MSILKKISLLFFASLLLMIYLTSLTNKTVEEKISSLYKQKYIGVSKKFLGYIIDADSQSLEKEAKKLHFVRRDIDLNDKKLEIVFEDNISFGTLKIFQKDGFYFLYIKYLDEESTFFDTSQEKDMQNKQLLNYLFSTDILLLVIIFLLIINMLRPLKNIASAMEKFGKGNHSCRIKELKSSDEISKVIKEFNKMAQNIDSLLTSRKQLLRDVSHELRTPIARLKLALDLADENKHTNILKEATNQIDNLTNELLNIEKLNSQALELTKNRYDIETILAQTLSRMLIEDESALNIDIKEKISLDVDIEYFSMALKNLIDNALKYNEKGIVQIRIEENEIKIKNKGTPLKYELDYYLEAFTQEDSSRTKKGYGIGLNIVKRVLDKHGFKLKYSFYDGYNIFTIIVSS